MLLPPDEKILKALTEFAQFCYKIHLGIGHVWMSPNDQYLCIVPDYRLVHVSLHHVFLPFDDDQMLSLILSKILLLTEDDKIKDELILKQF